MPENLYHRVHRGSQRNATEEPHKAKSQANNHNQTNAIKGCPLATSHRIASVFSSVNLCVLCGKAFDSR
jgi:hypothetical protein